jgi:hypothetical protein
MALAAIALLGYYGSREVKPVTGETQHIALWQEQEIQADVEAVGQKVVSRISSATP